MKLSQNFRMTQPREGNDLLDHGSFFIKSSLNAGKIHAEVNFFLSLPSEIKSYFPQFLGASTEGKWPDGYKIQKIPDLDASVYFVYGVENDEKSVYFRNMLQTVESYLRALPKRSQEKIASDRDFLKFILERDRSRLSLFPKLPAYAELVILLHAAGFSDFDDFANKIFQHLERMLRQQADHELVYSHGDLCLSNIIYSQGMLYLIDPRGQVNVDGSNFTSPYYDLAKLSQCLLGGYDFINHLQELTGFAPQHAKSFTDLIARLGLDLRLVRCVEASHFLSMLPLHAEAPKKCVLFLQQALAAFHASHD